MGDAAPRTSRRRPCVCAEDLRPQLEGTETAGGDKYLASAAAVPAEYKQPVCLRLVTSVGTPGSCVRNVHCRIKPLNYYPTFYNLKFYSGLWQTC